MLSREWCYSLYLALTCSHWWWPESDTVRSVQPHSSGTAGPPAAWDGGTRDVSQPQPDHTASCPSHTPATGTIGMMCNSPTWLYCELPQPYTCDRTNDMICNNPIWLYCELPQPYTCDRTNDMMCNNPTWLYCELPQPYTCNRDHWHDV